MTSPESTKGISDADVVKIRMFKLLLIVGVYMNVYGSYKQMELYWEHLLCSGCTAEEKRTGPFARQFDVIKSLSIRFFRKMRDENELDASSHYNQP